MIKRELNTQGIGMTSQRTRDRMVLRLHEQGIKNEAVLSVMRKIPRHLFVDEALATRSYEDTALPIGHGQTISQPFTVARMTELLLAGDTPPRKVLEVGTGSGYQAAVLAALVQEVVTVERIEPLYRATRNLLYDLGYRNIRTFLSDGSWGMERDAPFDAIIATAAPEIIPPALLAQLAIGGKLVIPTGKHMQAQVLNVITRIDTSDYTTVAHEAVLFVPLVSDDH